MDYIEAKKLRDDYRNAARRACRGMGMDHTAPNADALTLCGMTATEARRAGDFVLVQDSNEPHNRNPRRACPACAVLLREST